MIIEIALGRIFGRVAPRLSVRHSLSRTRALAIGSFPDGSIGKIVGNARPTTEQVVAPLSGRRCVHFQVEILTRRADESVWLPAYTASGGSAFVVTDATGDALVQVWGAELCLIRDIDTVSMAARVDRDRVAALMEGCRQPFRYWVTGSPGRYYDGHTLREVRCLESSIAVDERVAVCGRGVREAARDPSAVKMLRDAPSRLTFRAGRRVPLLISDRPSALR